MFQENQSDVRALIKPHQLEELQLRSTHYGGAVDKLMTTQKIGSGFKGIPPQINNSQATPQGFRPAPINFNKNTFQDMYAQSQNESVKATRVPNINSKTRYQKLQNHLYNAGSMESTREGGAAQGRDSPPALTSNGKPPAIAKLTSINMSKVESNMRTTHLKLDPIDTANSGFAGVGDPHTGRNNIIGVSMQFQKGMLTPIDPTKLPRDMQGNAGAAAASPASLKKSNANAALKQMNSTMYTMRNANSGISASQNHPPRRVPNE